MLTSKKRQELRKEAHHLKAKIQIGNNGINDSFINNINDFFNTNELIKIKVNKLEQKDDINIVAKQIAKHCKCEIVYIVGKTITFYKKKKENNEAHRYTKNKRTIKKRSK